MTAFELCRSRGLELAPVLRIVKYLGLDSGALEAAEVERVTSLYSHFRYDPELVVGRGAIAERSGVPEDRIESLLRERRQEIPFLGTPDRPMLPVVALAMLRRAHERAEPLAEPESEPARIEPETPAPAGDRDLRARIGRLERELAGAIEQVRSLSRTIGRLTDRVGEPAGARSAPTRRHRRSGGGRPDTIVEACRTVLSESAGPMKVADITERVLSSGVEIRAKNPNVTVSSILSSYEAFERVRRGYYTLSGPEFAD